MRVTSAAFAEGQSIPPLFTCKGTDRSPPLEFHDVPAAAKALALVMDDPDAPRGTWTHWTWWDLPPSVRSLREGADIGRLGGIQGLVSNQRAGYHGPCPPSGTHRYVFRLHALDSRLGLQPGARVDQVQAALGRHTLAQAQLMGTFTKA